VDYPAAQAYAAGLIALHCVERAGATEDGAVAAVARELRCTTFFGRFGLGPDGRQEDHEMLAVQWQDGVKRVVWPPSQAEAGVRAA
jgi:branched-chain amino acid transport system substrate-binding protein